MTAFTMPSLGADMDEGTLLEWTVRPGDAVAKGDIVAVVDTSKAAVEVETFVAGTVRELLVEPGATVAVGTPLAEIDPAGAPATSGPVVRAPVVRAPVAAPAPAARAAQPAPVAGHGRRPAPVSPLVRKLAHELGVDLSRVSGSGRNGAITRDDVLQARGVSAPAPPPRPSITPYARRLAAELGVDPAGLRPAQGAAIRAADVRAAADRGVPSTAAPGPERAAPSPLPRAVRATRMRATIAASMSRSKREIPHYYLSTTVDLEKATSWMHAYNSTVPVAGRLVPAALLLKAIAAAAREAPGLNGFWVHDRFEAAPTVHLGIAVSLRGGGLVAPAIHDAADLPLDELMHRLRDLVARARAGHLRASELSDPTLTVTNLGEQGVEAVFGVIYPPQVALVGLGRVVPRTCVVDGLIGVRPTTIVTLSADHRATDGFAGSRFLADIDDRLQRPEEL